ncbi:uncharacterized protein LOC118646575 [Monomorium pharaonis]|uniref:uncharacterized protein LOC118646575 n=1 Tax=Monomorium pharaonis TaxID=307658 RepID=UPI0017468E4B|nr:uncharacterized protein LOC118646575 [Monomorium pharaonis]
MNTEQLRRKRGSIKAQLTSARNFAIRANDDLESTTKEEIESRIQRLDDIYDKFQTISQQLSSEDDDEDEDRTEDTEFEDKYFAVRASLLRCLEKLKSSQASTSGENRADNNALTQILEQQFRIVQQLSERSNDNNNDIMVRILEQQGQMLTRINTPSNSSREFNVKLPIINLPVFSGQMEEWKRYADTFKTLIHNSDLSNVQKHQYLVSSLSGAAARVVESIEISEQNYEIAWDLLRERYEDEKAIRKRHVQCLFELPRVHRESSNAIRDLIDHVQKHLRVLQSMKLPTESWGELIISLIEKNLDSATRKRWEEHAEMHEELMTKTMIDFLQRRCQVLERAALSEGIKDVTSGIKTSEKNDNNKIKSASNSRLQTKTTLSTTIQGGRCYVCQGPHLIYTCNQFLNLSVKDRIQTVKKLKLCINCLRNDHFVARCTSSSCRECGERHNTLCHLSRGVSTPTTRENPETTTPEMGASVNLVTGSERSTSEKAEDGASGPLVHHVRRETSKCKRILMSTAIVEAKAYNYCNRQLRVLLDSASETNFITLAACRELGLRMDNVCESISGLNNMNCDIKHGCQLKLKSRISNYEVSLYCLVAPSLTKELPSFSIRALQILIPKNLELADPLFYNPSKIDVLIGGEIFFNLLEVGKIELSQDLPTLQNSKFGWLIAGPIPERLVMKQPADRSSLNAHMCLLTQKDEENNMLSRFWELEEYPVEGRVTMSAEELECESYFVNTMTRDSFGRFIVRLPFRKNKNKLEYIDLNHMSRATENLNITSSIYLPHHGVLRESSVTTKLRVVFDGSAKTSSGVSLNDSLMVGAALQDNIIDIILRFRLHAVAITADLKKMYRQVLINKLDRDYQRILWRFSTNEPIQEFRLNTVTYGLACAPFVAIRCVRQLASEAVNEFREASQVLLNDLYVDDILTGVSCESDAVEFNQLTTLLGSGGFEPHKWQSNCGAILGDRNRVEQSSSVAIDTNNVKTLGLIWHPNKDMFQFSIKAIANPSKSKREVLSTVSRLFDPLGLISPILIRAKIIMQQTWAANLSWDDPLTKVIFNNYGMRIDASLKAYGACVYLQTIDENGNAKSALLCSKSRVSPIRNKTITLPRLELCGAVALVRLVKNVRRALKVNFDKIYAWTDSTIVLAWISGDPSRQKTFVSNRSAEIQSSLPSDCWRHVRSSDNPADLISRGTNLKDLQQCKLWWEGPNWLSKFDNYVENELESITLSQDETEIVESEQKSELQVLVSLNGADRAISRLLSNYSSLSKIERILARIMRFIYNCKASRVNRNYDSISIKEIHTANQLLVRETQIVCFAKELADLKANKPISSSSKLLSLGPFIDETGLIRVGGRLQHSIASFRKKHPILLPCDSRFTHLLFEREHLRLLHAGPQALLYSIRERYWPINGRALARKIVYKCVNCFRNGPRSLSQIMGQLPSDRVIPKRPFFVTGIDFAGPITTLVNRGRGRKTSKSYVSLFVCFTTKAIHIEAVSDLTASAFIAALRRFVGRRGCPQRIYSDNATNFVGAKNEIKEIQEFINSNVRNISDEFCIPHNIEWKFIPPASPHMGGLWEAGIKSCKFYLKRIIGGGLLTFEELSTVLIQIEACLNSRPIRQLPSTPMDLQPLTPGHFIIGEPLTTVPEVDLSDTAINRLSRWQLIQKIAQDFWKRWSAEYLTSLQGKTKWKRKTPNLSVGDIVLIQDNNLPPLKWKLGKVVEAHAGADGNVRVVTLKTASGVCKRAINKLCKLPISDELNVINDE